MTHVRRAILTFGFLFAATAPVCADDDATARALVEKAVKAHGGQQALDKFPGRATKFKASFYGMGEGVPITGEVTTFGPDKQKIDIEVEAGGQKFQVVIVLDGNKGWNKLGKDLKELDKDELAEAKEQAYAAWVATLAPLKDKAFAFATTGEIQIEKRTALGVKVSSKGHRDVDLYFDKGTGLLVKTETRVKDDASGQEVNEEAFPSEYKEVQGTKHAMKAIVKRNGKLFMEVESTEVRLHEKLDADTFAKP